jgi:Tfp pilus assembly protein FimT
MNRRTTAMHARSRRRGYTLFEVVLVCAVLVLMATMAYPSLRGMYPAFKRDGAVDAVRAAWAYARARAIEEGRPYRFALDEAGSHYRVAPDRDDYWSGSPPQNDPDGQGLILEDALPSGVHINVNGNSSPPPDDATTKDVKTASSGNWSPVAVFLPDGTAKQDVRIPIQIKGARAVELQLRGLTGSVQVSHP